MGIGNSYATFEEKTGYTPEANPHISNTIPRGTSLEFWMMTPRPTGVTFDAWEEKQQQKWDRIFKKGKQ